MRFASRAYGVKSNAVVGAAAARLNNFRLLKKLTRRPWLENRAFLSQCIITASSISGSTEEEDRKVVQPLVYFLRGGIMGDEAEAEARRRRWWWTASFKARLGCFGAAWGLPRPSVSVSDDEDDHDDDVDREDLRQTPDAGCVSLAAALAAERELRAVQLGEEVTGTPPLVASVRGEAEGGGGGGGCCCVCMERKKDAAFIPCGHTFCRTCASDIRVGRGSCPLCNRRILDILNIF